MLPTLAAIAAPTSIIASQTAGRVVRRASWVPSADPNARPLMNAAAIVANAYVVGPMTSASSRVHATSYINAAKPEIATAAHASTGAGELSRRGNAETAEHAELLCSLASKVFSLRIPRVLR